MKKKTKNTFEKTAILGDKCYKHFGIHPKTAALYGDKPEDIVVVVMKVSEDQSIPEPNSKCVDPDYWVWYDEDNKEFSSMLYAQRFLLNMCFPSGIKGSEDAGQGKAYRVEIVEVKKYYNYDR